MDGATPSIPRDGCIIYEYVHTIGQGSSLRRGVGNAIEMQCQKIVTFSINIYRPRRGGMACEIYSACSKRTL